MKRRSALLALAALLCAPLASHAADDPLGASANAAFLAANAKKPGTIIRPSGLQYRVLRSGTGKRPGANDVIRLVYAIRLVNGALVDSTTPVLPATLVMSSVAMAGLAEALSLMHAGDRWQLAIPANLAFGDKGAMNGAIPPGQSLLVDVTLVSAAPPEPGQTVTENPFSVWGNGRENGAAFTIRP
jgi:FKBP-type peptidyl-prolyl cis-trans isomerase